MTPTATYIAEENCLQEFPRMEVPKYRVSHWPHGSLQYYNSLKAWAEYNAHLATLRRISCDPSCKGLWQDGQKVVEGKDYEVKEDPIPYFDHIDDPTEYRTRAYAIVPVKSEDADWREMLQTVFDHHVTGYDANMDYNRAIVELKQKYLPLTKR